MSDKTPITAKINYCPMCGAAMDKEAKQ